MSRLVELVNTALGTLGSGNCLIGPYLPHGMVRVGPDSFFPQKTNGYQPGQAILGFSHTHVAGTGGSSRYGNIRLMPFSGEPQFNPIPPFISVPLKQRNDAVPYNEAGSVGYYSAEFKALSVKAELSCTRHVGVHRYTYSDDDIPRLLVDAGAVIQTRGAPCGEVSPVEEWDSVGISTDGFLKVENDCELSGRSDFIGGWGHHHPYSIYFYLRSRQPFSKVLLANRQGMCEDADSIVQGAGCRAVLEYNREYNQIEVDAGISFVSVVNARERVQKEVGSESLDCIRETCEEEWEGWLNRFHLKGGDPVHQRIFYSLVYRLMCMPTDLGIDEENPYWKSGVRQFTDFYCLWDSVRNANSLYHLFAPELSEAFLNALIDIAEHTGWLPDAHIAGKHAYMQSGCACDIIFSEAQAKGIQNVDYSKALHYVKKNCEEESPDPQVKGRYLDNYHNLGYVTTDVAKSCVSRHIEYTYYDWCISRLAEKTGDKKAAKRFLEYSERIWNLWRDDQQSFWPRNADGSWADNVNTGQTTPDSWNDPYSYEGPISVWSLNVMQDIPGLIERMGGNEPFVAHLDKLFDKGLTIAQETRMHVPHLYTYAGRPDKAGERIHMCLRDHFSNQPDGLNDNEDMGCQSSFFIFNSMGIYPVYGQTLYLLTPPMFNEIVMSYGKTGKKLTIVSNRASSDVCYIKSAKLNNTPLERAWVKHDEIADGGILEFDLSLTPTTWGQEILPPGGCS
ncbi:GH92 family glycosyl hydrolase [Planctomycetota bacterium]